MKPLRFLLLIIYVILGLIYPKGLRLILSKSLFSDSRIPENYKGHVYYFFDEVNIFLTAYGLIFFLVVVFTSIFAFKNRKNSNEKVFWTTLLVFNIFWSFYFFWNVFLKALAGSVIF